MGARSRQLYVLKRPRFEDGIWWKAGATEGIAAVRVCNRHSAFLCLDIRSAVTLRRRHNTLLSAIANVFEATLSPANRPI